MKAVRSVVAIGIGAALFFVIGYAVRVPIFANTNIGFQYAILAFFGVVFGPVVGGLVGLIGHALIDLTYGWGIWWSWVIVSGIVGVGFGLLKKLVNIETGFGVKKAITFNIGNLICNGLGWALIAPILDQVIYKEPFDKVITQGWSGGISNFLAVLVIGTLLLFLYSKTKFSKGSLTKE